MFSPTSCNSNFAKVTGLLALIAMASSVTLKSPFCCRDTDPKTCPAEPPTADTYEERILQENPYIYKIYTETCTLYSYEEVGLPMICCSCNWGPECVLRKNVGKEIVAPGTVHPRKEPITSTFLEISSDGKYVMYRYQKLDGTEKTTSVLRIVDQRGADALAKRAFLLDEADTARKQREKLSAAAKAAPAILIISREEAAALAKTRAKKETAALAEAQAKKDRQ